MLNQESKSVEAPETSPVEPMAFPERSVSKGSFLRDLGIRVAVALTMVSAVSLFLLGTYHFLEAEAEDRARIVTRNELIDARLDAQSALLEQQLAVLQDIVVAPGVAVAPMVPPDNNKLFTILSQGVGITEYEFLPSSVGTTPAAAFATDLTTVQRTNAYTQEFYIGNKDGTDDLCWKPIAWASAGANCNAKCVAAALTVTCSGASTDGFTLPPGGGVTRRFDGTSCLCVVGEAAGVIFQTERVVR